jgi:hypothetical protein
MLTLRRLLSIALLLTVSSAQALGFRERCQLALATAKTKGVRLALASWPHFADAPSPSDQPAPETDEAQLTEIYAARVARHVNRALEPWDREVAVIELALDRGTSAEMLEDAIQLARRIPLHNVVDLLKALREHPGLSEPSQILTVALNRHVPAKIVSGLILQALHEETRYDGDLSSFDVPYSARPAARILQLNREGRINDGSFLVTFDAMFAQRRAKLGGIFSMLGILEIWVRDLYAAHKPLPERRLTRPLARTIRRRLTELDGDKNLSDASFATLTRIEILLGL